MNSLASKGSPKHGRFCGTCGLEPRHGTTQQVGRRVSFAALLLSCLVCRCHLTCQPSFSRTFRFAKRQAWWAMKWHGFMAVMYDFRSCRRGMAVLQKLSMLNDGTLKMPIVVDDPTHDSNAFPPICWIHHEGSTNKIRMPNKIGNLVLVSDIILQQNFFFRANLSDGIQSLVLYSIECADTSFRDLESFLLVERFIASEIFRGKKCWEMWVPNRLFWWPCNDYWEW